mgnify:CR=1 FL=1
MKFFLPNLALSIPDIEDDFPLEDLELRDLVAPRRGPELLQTNLVVSGLKTNAFTVRQTDKVCQRSSSGVKHKNWVLLGLA